MGAIDEKYGALSGSTGFLGQPTSSEQDCPDHRGRFRHFQTGSIYWSPETDAHEVHGLIREKWAALGWERSPVGYPVTDEMSTLTGAGRFNNFQYGSISWTPQTGAHAVYGAIRDKWAALGREGSFLGFPVTDESRTPDGHGRYNHFQGGSIYWTPLTGAQEVHGLIRAKWAELSWERSFLGYPLTDETATPDGVGRFNHFQGGSIYWTPEAGAHEVHGVIREKWAALGSERSFLGYPTSDELATPGPGRFSRFQHGGIYWTPTTGPKEVAGAGLNYVISLDSFHIDNTRSWHEDTDHVSLGMKVGDQMMGDVLVMHMGDVNNGNHPVGLHVGPFHIDNPATPITFNYQIMNSGHKSYEDIQKALKDGANALASSSAVTGNWWAAAGIVVAKWGIDIGLADCDGPVAVDQVVVPGADLINWTAGHGMYNETRSYPGTDSQAGCGGNSRYTVTWSVVRL